MADKDNLNQILEKFLYGDNGYIVNIEGTWMPNAYIDLKDIVLNYEVYDDDVWVCTFPKSGTTWMQEMVWLLGNNLDYEGAKEDLAYRYPFLEIQTFIENKPGRQLPAHIEDSLNFIKNMKRPRYIKTHLPWKLLPKQIQTGEKKPKIIYVSRNPKDACISYYHHMKLFYSFTGTFSEFIQVYLAGKTSFGPYWNSVLDFYNNKSNNIIYIRFEDMKLDLESVVLKVAEFLGKNIDGDDLKKLVHHLSFEQMKNNRAVNKEPALEVLRKFNKNVGTGSFIRQGKSGNYKEEMSSEQIQAFDDWIEEHIKNTDYIL